MCFQYLLLGYQYGLEDFQKILNFKSSILNPVGADLQSVPFFLSIFFRRSLSNTPKMSFFVPCFEFLQR